MITPIVDLSAYSGAGYSLRRVLYNMPPVAMAKEKVINMRFPVVDVPPSPHVKGEFGTWNLVTKPNCRPYYMATLLLVTSNDDEYNVNFILDPDDDTADDVLQKRVDARIADVILQVEEDFAKFERAAG